MHIPNHMMDSLTSIQTVGLSALGVGYAAWCAKRAEKKPSIGRFSTVSGLLFLAQMLNFQIAQGTSAHLLGGVLAVALLGVPFGVLAMSLVVALQAVLFNDGGILALGANITNMALVGGFVGIIIERERKKVAPLSVHSLLMLGLGSWIAVMVGALLCVIEISASGYVQLQEALQPMLYFHSIVGLTEAGLTILAVALFYGVTEKSQTRYVPFCLCMVLFIVGICAVPLASSLPDAFEASLGVGSFESSGESIMNEIVAAIMGVSVACVSAYVLFPLLTLKLRRVKK